MSGYGRSPPRIEGMVSLKVDNLAYRTTLEDLRRVFNKYGEVGDIYIPRNPFSQDSRGFAFVRFYNDRDADSAIRAMDGRRLDGREIRVQRAMYGRPNSRRRRSPSPRRKRSRSFSPRRRSSPRDRYDDGYKNGSRRRESRSRSRDRR